MFLIISTAIDDAGFKTIGDDRWHKYLSIDVSYVSQFDRYVISSILIIIITITHTQFRLFLIVSTTIIDIGSGTIGDDTWMHFDWCILCISIRSVCYLIPFSIITITITHTRLRLFLIISTTIDDIEFETNGDVFLLMYLMSLNSIGMLFYIIFNYHHCDNSHTTTLVFYYLHSYLRYRIRNKWRR